MSACLMPPDSVAAETTPRKGNALTTASAANASEPLERLREGQRFAAPASAGAEHAALRAAWSQLARRLQLGRATHVFSDFRDGLIGKDRTFLSWDATLKAVGLSE